MPEAVKILWKIDDEAIRWQKCAICGQQRQRVLRQEGRPDFVLCEACHSTFILEDGGKMQMLYGRIPENMTQTRAFALKQWQVYFEICARSAQDRRQEQTVDALPAALKPQANPTIGVHATSQDAYLALEAEKAELLYNRARKLDAPPRRLRETGELPNLDDLFKDRE
jgi:hypothetical protein